MRDTPPALAPTPAQAVRYAIYTRQSVAKLGDPFGSCAAQRGICQDFIAAQAGSHWQWIGVPFDDAGISGVAGRRPALDRLMDRIAAGEIQKVAVYSLDRLARTLRQIVAIAEGMRQHGAELLVVNVPMSAEGPSGNLAFNLMATVAEFEWSMIRSRILDSIAARKHRRLRLAGAIPYGYAADPRTHQLVPDAVESGRVAAIFQLALDGVLPAVIAATINAQGWRTKTHVSRRSGRRQGGSPWTPRQILSLLRNPTVLGLFRDGQGTRQGNHRPIVTREVFDQVQDRIADRRTGDRQRARSSTSALALRGKIACPCCGRFLSPHMRTVKTCKQASIATMYYRCRSHAGGRPPCRGTAVPSFAIESAVMETMGGDDLASRCSDLKRSEVRRFQIHWVAADACERRHWLFRLVERVEIDRTAGGIRVTVNEEAMRAFVAGHPTP